MASYISFQPGDFFNTKLYTGNQATGNAVTGVGFQPDFVWVKDVDGVRNHVLFDSVRGTETYYYSNTASGNGTDPNSLSSFDADGFTVGSWEIPNYDTHEYGSWNWKGGTTSGKPTVDETITPTGYNYSATSGFGIYKWDGTSSAGLIAHGLGAAQAGGKAMLFVKRYNGTTDWQAGHSGFTSWVYQISLNLSTVEQTSTEVFNSTGPTATTFSLGDSGGSNYSSRSYIGYLFMERRGFSKFGHYEGNGNVDGPFIYTGFKPNMILLKNTDLVSDWEMSDIRREGYNDAQKRIKPNDTSAQQNSPRVRLLSNGFKLLTSDGTYVNGGGNRIAYAAFADKAFVSSNSVPTTAR